MGVFVDALYQEVYFYPRLAKFFSFKTKQNKNEKRGMDMQFYQMLFIILLR